MLLVDLPVEVPVCLPLKRVGQTTVILTTKSFPLINSCTIALVRHRYAGKYFLSTNSSLSAWLNIFRIILR